MAQLDIRYDLSAPATAVWDLIGDMNRGARWPAVASCKVEGAGAGCTRTLELIDGAIIRERLQEHDDLARSYRTKIFQMGRLPLARLEYTVTVHENGPDACAIEWDITFEPADAPEEELRRKLEGIFISSARSIADTLGLG